jgi:hypothetical protein
MEWQSCVSGKTFKPNKREAGGGSDGGFKIHTLRVVSCAC